MSLPADHLPAHECDSAAEACAACEWQKKMDAVDPAQVKEGA